MGKSYIWKYEVNSKEYEYTIEKIFTPDCFSDIYYNHKNENSNSKKRIFQTFLEKNAVFL